MRGRAWMAGIAGLGAGLGGVALAPSAASAERVHATGFHVTGQHQLPGHLKTGGTFALDRNRAEHVVAMPHPNHRHGPVNYYVRRRHSEHWTVHRIPGEITGTYNVLASDLSPSGRRLLVIHAKGRNLKTTDVSVRVRRVPRMVSAFDPGSDFRNDNFVGATALAHHHAVLLLNRFETPLVSIGKAGHRFSTPTALPNPDGLIFVLGGITHDTATGDVVVVETAVNQHILGSVTGAYVWTRSTDGTWSDPVQVAPAGYAARAVTAFAGKVSVAVTSRVGDPNTGDTVLSTVDRSAGGTWSPPVRIPHARFGTFDGVVMTTNAATGSIHVAYTGDSGIVHRARVKGVWHGRHVLAGRFTTPLALAVTPHGKPILGYDQH